MTPTLEQLRVCDFITDGVGNAIVDACAGGAKTTTLTLAAARLPKGKLNLCFAFNKDIATTLQSRMPYWVTSSTWHSHMYDALGRHLGGKPKVDGRKCAHILKKLMPDFKVRREVEEDVLALVSRAKAFGYKCAGIDKTSSLLLDLADRFDVETDISLVEEVLEVDMMNLSSVDFDDMLWLSLRLGVAVGVPDFVLLDEAQDTNIVQRALLKRMLAGGSRLLAVGDPHQSIYGFRGADSNAMTALATEFSCHRLGLTVSWRCSKAVVMEAQKYL